MNLERSVQLAFFLTVVLMSVIIMAVLGGELGSATHRDAPEIVRLEELRAPVGGGSRWVAVEDVEIFRQWSLFREQTFVPTDGDASPPGWHYLPLVRRGDPTAAAAAAHLDALDGRGPLDAEARRHIEAVVAATRVFVAVRSRSWEQETFELQRDATTARGIMRNPPEGLGDALANAGASADVCILELEKTPTKSWHCIAGLVIGYAVLVSVFLYLRRSGLFGPATGELYGGLGAGVTQVVVELLMFMGAAVDRRDPFGRTTLHMAVLRDHPRVVRRLLARGLDVDGRDEDDETPLHKAAAVVRDGHLVELLLEAGADPLARDANGRTPAELESSHPSRVMRSEENRRRIQELLTGAGISGREGAGSPPAPARDRSPRRRSRS